MMLMRYSIKLDNWELLKDLLRLLLRPDPVAHTIIFWSNGFTIDDGPLRKLDDPDNASFLESIRKSECPKELEPEDRRAPVHVNLMRREEKCPEREKPKVSFQGVGRTLGATSLWLLIPHPFLYKPGSQQQQHHLRVL
ncbi:SEP domain protein [Raphanus sativus]|nr:SEP domain protein [Raphanus sativus]